jgi:hypothetical protein
VLPVLARGREHSARVAAEVGLGQAEAADRLAGRELGEPVFLLLLAPERVDRVHHQAALHRHERAQAAVAALELLVDQARSDIVQSRASVLVRQRGAEHAQLGQLRHDLHRERAGLEVRHHARDVALADPRAHGVAHHALVFGELLVELQEIELAESFHRGSKGRGTPA